MASLLNLYIGNQASNLGLASQYLDIQNWFQEDDPIKHDMSKLLFIGQNLDLAKMVNYNNFEKEIQPDVNLDYVKSLNIQHNSIYNYKLESHQDSPIFTSTIDNKQLNGIADTIDSQLEKIDRCDGFEMIVDCDCSYGSLGLAILELLDDLQGIKVPRFTIPLLNNENENHNLINRILTLTKYQQQASILLPLYLDSSKFNFFKPQQGLPLYQQLSFIINNITYPYKCIENTINMELFYQRIVPQKTTNIFNLITYLPTKQTQEKDSILAFKQHFKNSQYDNIQEKIIFYQDGQQSFGESYFMRGESPIPKQNQISTYGLDIRMINYVYEVPQKYQGLFKQENDNQLSLHTCLFSNECYKYSLLNYQNRMSALKQKDYLQYFKQQFDDLHETQQQLSQLIENYGGIEIQSDDDDDQ